MTEYDRLLQRALDDLDDLKQTQREDKKRLETALDTANTKLEEAKNIADAKVQALSDRIVILERVNAVSVGIDGFKKYLVWFIVTILGLAITYLGLGGKKPWE